MMRKSGILAICMTLMFVYCFFVQSPALAGQTVVVDGDTANNVFGNGVYDGSGVVVGVSSPDGNTVIVNQGDIGGGGEVFGGHSGNPINPAVSSSASGNAVIVNGGEMSAVIGGYATANLNGTATASGNSVTVNGGAIRSGVIVGGMAGASNSASAFGNVTNNTITLSGSPVFDAVTVEGGQLSASGFSNSDAFTGNTLNIWNFRQNGAVADVANFQYYNFLLPGDQAESSTVLDVTGAVTVDNSRNGDGAIGSTFTGLNVMAGGPEMGDGYFVTLIPAGKISGDFANIPLNADGVGFLQYTGKKGFSLLYDWSITKSDDGLVAMRIGDPRVNPGIKGLSEGRLAGLAFVNQGAELLAGSGIPAALRTAAGRTGPAAFAVGEGGESRYKTGSHVALSGFSLLTGLAWNRGRGRDAASGVSGASGALFGAFVEAGWAGYDSLNDSGVPGSGVVRGGGDTSYYGGGLFGRISLGSPVSLFGGSGVWHAEGSIRAGRSGVDFASGDLTDGMGRAASYDIAKTYYGGHIGAGYFAELANGATFDLNAAYFHTRIGGESLDILGDPIEFKRLVSNRVRGGARLSSRALPTAFPFAARPYVGAAYEYEFSADADATAYGLPVDSPSLGGGTAIAELGVTLTGFAGSAGRGNNNLSAEIGVRGYMGARNGVAGGVRIGWTF